MAGGSVYAIRPFGQLPPLSLYIHIPWCVRKCPYCDFYSVARQGALPEERYLPALRKDLVSLAGAASGRPVETVFIGGGTPSLFSEKAIKDLMDIVRGETDLASDAEITVEANPGAVDERKFASFADSGINRVSVGVQSFDDAMLRRLGRIHSAAEAVSAVTAAKRAFDSVNIDLMYDLPGQTSGMLRADLETAFSLDPSHMSIYQLTVEPGTPFAKNPPEQADEDTSEAMQETVESLTEKNGFIHYEVSAYAKAGKRCRHNLNYWTYGDYLGIGAAAHGKISYPDGRIVRQARVADPEAYMAGLETGRIPFESFGVEGQERVFEFMMNALRLRGGFDMSLMTGRTGLPIQAFEEPLKEALGKGLLVKKGGAVAPSALGMRFLNDLQEIFLPK